LNNGVLRFIGVVERVDGETSKIQVYSEFCEALKGLDMFSHIIILYWLHLRDNDTNRRTLRVVPRMHQGAPEVGVFACRSPSRPDPIGLSVAEVSKIDGCSIFVRELDAVEGTPIIDIKPYRPRADSIPQATTPEWALHGPKT